MKVTIVVGVSAAYWRCFDSVLNIDQISELAEQIAKDYEAKGNKVVYSVSDDGEIEFRLNETRVSHYYYAIVDTEHLNVPGNEISIDVRELDWHNAKLQQPPKDQPIVAIAPAGNVSIFLGRELLDWTGWLTIDEFDAQVKKLVKKG